MSDAMKGSRAPVPAGHPWYKCALPHATFCVADVHFYNIYRRNNGYRNKKSWEKLRNILEKLGTAWQSEIFLSIGVVLLAQRHKCRRRQSDDETSAYKQISIPVCISQSASVIMLQRSNVITLQRSDIIMFQCPNVTTLWCANITTSWRYNIPTLQRANISTLQQPVMTVDQCR